MLDIQVMMDLSVAGGVNSAVVAEVAVLYFSVVVVLLSVVAE